MESLSNQQMKLMYRRPQSRDKYEVMADVLDDILNQLSTINKRLEKLENELCEP